MALTQVYMQRIMLINQAGERLKQVCVRLKHSNMPQAQMLLSFVHSFTQQV